MPDHNVRAYPAIEAVVGSIAAWVNKYRSRLGSELGHCSAEEVMQTARDLGLSAGELRAIAAKGPHAADRLHKMLLALGTDPGALTKTDPVVMRDMQRLCTTCGHKRRCGHELARGTAARDFRDFCPNAYTLDALLEKQGEKLAIRH